MALIFPSGGIYHVLFNNVKSFRGQRWTCQPFGKELRGIIEALNGPGLG